MNDDQQYFKVGDIVLASVLHCQGIPLEVIEPDPDDYRRAIFCYRRVSGLDGLIQQFWSGQLRVEPKSLFASQRELKTRVRSLP